MKAEKDNHGFSKNKKKWKCDYCLCQHPKWDHSCGCPCTKHSKQNCPNPAPEKKKKADLAEAVGKKRKQQSEAESGAVAAGTMLVQETSEDSAVLPAQPTGHLLDYLNQAQKMFLAKETDDTIGTTTKAELLVELE